MKSLPEREDSALLWREGREATLAPVGADFNSGRSPDESRGLSRGQFLLVACLMSFSTRDLAWKRSKQLVVMPLALSL